MARERITAQTENIKARNLVDIFNLFRVNALTDNQKGYYVNLSRARLHESLAFHDVLLQRIVYATSSDRTLIVGHGGCGKSTELNMLEPKLREAGYLPILIDASCELDTNDFTYVDIMVLIVQKFTEYAKDVGISGLDHLAKAFEEAISIKTTTRDSQYGADTELTAAMSGKVGFAKIFNISALLSSRLRLSAGYKDELRREIAPNISAIVKSIDGLLQHINNRLARSAPAQSASSAQFAPRAVILIDGLEKCNLSQVKKLFLDGGASLAAIEGAHLVMCSPLWLHRSEDSALIGKYFSDTLTMPMVGVKDNPQKINTTTPQESDAGEKRAETDASMHAGVLALRELVLRRASARFFQKGVLESIIAKTGGCLRDLCYILSNAAFNAHINGRKTIDMETVDRFLANYRLDLFLRIEESLYPRVLRIYNGEHAIQRDNDLTRLFYGGVVFEYDGTRWCDMHPLVRDYIDENGGAKLLERH